MNETLVTEDFRCGHIALIGRPNVGKSTLLNHLIGQKISITARKPQTTRHRVLGIKTTPQCQYVYVDTPGIHHGESRALHRYLNRAARSILPDMQVIVFVIEALKWTDEDDLVIAALQSITAPVIAVINKIDRITDKSKLLPILEQISQRRQFAALVPISALKSQHLEQLQTAILNYLPKSPPLFPDDALTDKSSRFVATEFIREKLIRNLAAELPYATSVEIEQFDDTEKLLRIHATIWVERDTQKAIVIGKDGATLKRIGQQARIDLEHFFAKKVFIQTWVKVKSGWSDDERALQQLGYRDEH
ncbi:MAG: GTPase Era [Gammaproteobacteria bacterium]|nr:GTPase Era [Gammaproteobacteria bacterium]